MLASPDVLTRVYAMPTPKFPKRRTPAPTSKNGAFPSIACVLLMVPVSS